MNAKLKVVKPTPHNPDNVAPAQLNPVKPSARKGGKRWRLLDKEERKRRTKCATFHREIQTWREGAWDGSGWNGSCGAFTYRTRLTRAELAKLK